MTTINYPVVIGQSIPLSDLFNFVNVTTDLMLVSDNPITPFRSNYDIVGTDITINAGGFFNSVPGEGFLQYDALISSTAPSAYVNAGQVSSFWKLSVIFNATGPRDNKSIYTN